MTLLTDPKSWLKKAIILTCTATILAQAVVMPASASTDHAPEQVQSSIQMKVKDMNDIKTFKAKSMSGEDVMFLFADSDQVMEVAPGLSNSPSAMQFNSDQGGVVCAVSDASGMVANLGNGIIQIDSLEHGAIVDGSLTRLTTNAHEYGHCLDFISSSEISQAVNAAGVSPYTVPHMAIADAINNGKGTLDFAGTVSGSSSSIQANAESSKHLHAIGSSLMETYADLHGALQTARTTGDLRGFSEFELSIRVNNLQSYSHTTAFTVATILKQEQANGFDANNLKGASYEDATAAVNDMFTRHFSKDGQISIHSSGFKNIVKEFEMKSEVGYDLPEGIAKDLSKLSTLIDATPSNADKTFYVDLMQSNIEHQHSLTQKGREGNESIKSAIESVAATSKIIEGHKSTLGVESSDSAKSLFQANTVDKGDLKSAAAEFFINAINIENAGLEKTVSFSSFIDKTPSIDREIKTNEPSLGM